MTLSNAAKQAQDAARQDTGQFGNQPHTESGIVPVLTPSMADRVVDNMTDRGFYLKGFEGFNGEGFREEVDQVARLISVLEHGTDTPLVFNPDEEYSSDQIGFNWHGFEVLRVTGFDDLTTDHDATGADAVRAIATALVTKRDAMVAEFKATLATN